MEGFLPATKSFISTVLVCPFAALEMKTRRIKSEAGLPAMIGLCVHKFAGKIEIGSMTLEAFVDRAPVLLADYNLFDSDTIDDVIKLVKVASYDDPIPKKEKGSLEIEKYFAVDENGNLATNKNDALIHGYIDSIFVRPGGTVHVKEWKTERMPKDLLEERCGYTLGAMALYPKATKFEFARHYLRTQEYLIWSYEVSSEDNRKRSVRKRRSNR